MENGGNRGDSPRLDGKVNACSRDVAPHQLAYQ